MLILLLVHPIDALIFLIFLLILQQVEGNMIYPAWWAPPLAFPPVDLFAVVFWGGVLGIPGILSAHRRPTAVIYQLLRTSVRSRLRQRNIDPKDPQFPLPPEEDEASQPPDQQRLDDV